jgi:hypothetical protein
MDADENAKHRGKYDRNRTRDKHQSNVLQRD